MKRLSTENRQYLGGFLAFIALVGLFALAMFGHQTTDGVYLHVFNNDPFALTVYSVTGSDKEKLERMGEVPANGDNGFWLSDRLLDFHWRFLGKQGQVIKRCDDQCHRCVDWQQGPVS